MLSWEEKGLEKLSVWYSIFEEGTTVEMAPTETEIFLFIGDANILWLYGRILLLKIDRGWIWLLIFFWDVVYYGDLIGIDMGWGCGLWTTC